MIVALTTLRWIVLMENTIQTFLIAFVLVYIVVKLRNH